MHGLAGVGSLSSEVLDYESLVDRAGGDEEFAFEILNDLRAGVPRDVAELEAALGAEDHSSAGRVAHRLKGALLAVGANPAAKAAHAVEEAAHDDPRGLSTTMVKLAHALEETLREVDRILTAA